MLTMLAPSAAPVRPTLHYDQAAQSHLALSW